MAEYSSTEELKRTLEVYVYALSEWRNAVDAISRNLEARGLSRIPVELGDERGLYRYAQHFVNGTYLGELPTWEGSDEILRIARSYLLSFEPLYAALEGLTQHLDEVSGEGSA